MPYDESLAERVRARIGDEPSVTEQKMFGGIAFMNSGNMAVGVSNDELMVRVSPDDYQDMIAEPGVRPFDMTGRPMKGWVLVAPDETADPQDLHDWIDIGMRFSGSLPPK